MAEELIEPPDAGATLARATLWTLAAVGAGLGMQVVMSLGRSISKDMAWIDAFAELSARPFGQMLTQMFGYGGVLLAVTILAGRQTVIHLRARTTTVAFAVVLGVALQFPLAELSNTTRMIFGYDPARLIQLRYILEPTDPVRGALTVFALVVGAPILEEAFFRGLLLAKLRIRYGAVGAVVYSALFFGVVHFRLEAAVPALVAGLLLGAIRLRSVTILPCIVIHAAHNAVPLLLPSRLLEVPGLNSTAPGLGHVPVLLLVVSTFVALAAAAGLVASEAKEIDATAS